MDEFTGKWITENAVDEIKHYDPGVLTIRGLHYRLVARGLTNSLKHYKRVVAVMGRARWAGIVPFDTFSDHDREVLGRTEYDETDVEEAEDNAKDQIQNWMNYYYKNAWENQDNYIEVWIEKKALQGLFRPVCEKYHVALAPCKGYPSLTFLNDAAARFDEAQRSHHTKILYFGDYDPSGEDIPRSIQATLERMGVDVEVDRRLLLEEQVLSMGLPPAPAKSGDSRTANWDGLGQVELDAVEPNILKSKIDEAILENRDEELYEELMITQRAEREIYRSNLKEFVKGL